MRRTRVVAALSVIALVAAACTSHSAVNSGGGTGTTSTIPESVKTVDAVKQTCPAAVTSSCIAIGNVSTISGIVPGLFEGAAVGTDAYLSYIDSTQHGVDGRRLLTLTPRTTSSTGTTTRSETQALIGQGDRVRRLVLPRGPGRRGRS